MTPRLVDGRAVGMENIVHIAAGGAHTAAVSAAGMFQQDMNGITLGIIVSATNSYQSCSQTCYL